MNLYQKFFKRLLDLVVSISILITSSPILMFLIIILFIQNEKKVIFTQSRVGKGKKPFKIIKFKTMTDKTNKDGQLLPDIERITQIGKWFRKLSLDELPQLINVIKGEMSLIGPRPLPLKYLPLYSNEQQKRFEVKPGITGLAQVNGRNSISWTQKFEYDLLYVRDLSFSLDFKIFWLTIYRVLDREGVNQSKERPMQPFNGEN